MKTAKLFSNGSSQAVRLPLEFRFLGDEVYIQKVGDSVMLYPKKRAWETFLEGVEGFTDDYFSAVETAHINEIPSERETL